MNTETSFEQRVLEKIRELPRETAVEVENFIDFLRQRNADRALTMAAAKLSEPAFQKIWDNPEDPEYDNL
ncbi:toxin-antitoxin system, antitoxin component, Xre family protein [Phormidesmis priestleyi]